MGDRSLPSTTSAQTAARKAPCSQRQTRHLADELRGIARLGLTYAQNDHDRDRYERVLAAANSEGSDRLWAQKRRGDGH